MPNFFYQAPFQHKQNTLHPQFQQPAHLCHRQHRNNLNCTRLHPRKSSSPQNVLLRTAHCYLQMLRTLQVTWNEQRNPLLSGKSTWIHCQTTRTTGILCTK